MISQVITFLFDLNHKHPSALGPVFQRKVPFDPSKQKRFESDRCLRIKVKLENQQTPFCQTPHQALSPRCSACYVTLACSLPSARLCHHSPSRLSPHGCQPWSSPNRARRLNSKDRREDMLFQGNSLRPVRHLEHIRPPSKMAAAAERGRCRLSMRSTKPRRLPPPPSFVFLSVPSN